MADQGDLLTPTADNTSGSSLLSEPPNTNGSTADNVPISTETAPPQPDGPPKPFVLYTRPVLLHLSKSPLVSPPEGMPELKDWFGDWNEQQPPKKESDGNAASRPRFRRDADDADTPPRDTTTRPFKPTFSQATQMGSFRHQPLRLETNGSSSETAYHRERNNAPGGDKDRERDRHNDSYRDRDRDGHERLRSLSDRYDRDRQAALASPNGNGLPTATSLRRNEREGVSHLSSARTPSTASISGLGSLNTGRDRDGRRANDATSDSSSRKPADSSTPSTTTGRTRSGTITESRNERSNDWRRIARDDKADRDKDKERRSRSRDPKRDKDSKDKDWGDSESAPRKDAWGVAANGSSRRERDGDRDRSGQKGRERDKDKSRLPEPEEKEPAWMDDWTPDPSSTNQSLGFGAFANDGKLDEWKKGMKEKEKAKEKERKERGNADDSLPAAQQPGEALDDIQRFKMMMKEGQTRKESPTSGNDLSGAPPGLPTKPSTSNLESAVSSVATDPAIIQSRSAVLPDTRPPFNSIPSSALASEFAASAEKAGPLEDNTGPSQSPPILASISLKSLGLSSSPIDDKRDYATGPLSTENRPSLNDPAIVNQSFTPQDPTSVFKNLLRPSSTSQQATSSTNGTGASSPISASGVIGPTAISRPLSSTASAAHDPESPAPSRNLSSGTNAAAVAATVAAAGGRQSKFAKFFQKEESPGPMSGLTSGNMATPTTPSAHSGVGALGTPSLNGHPPTATAGPAGLSSGIPGSTTPNGPIGHGGMASLQNALGNVHPSSHQMSHPVRHPSNEMNVHNPVQGSSALNALFGNAFPPTPSASSSAPGSAHGSGFLDKRLDGAPGSGMSMQDILAALGAGSDLSQSRQQISRQPSKPQLGSQPQALSGPGGFPPHHFLSSTQPPHGQTPMPHVPPPQQQLPFNPNPANDINDPGRFVADGMVPGLRPARNPREQNINAGGLYNDDRVASGLMDDRERMAAFNLARLGPQQQQQQLAFEQQRELQARNLYSQGLAHNGNMGRAAANGMAGQFRHTGPSPIGGQNPLNAMNQHQRVLSGLGRTPAELAAMRNPAAAELLAAASMRTPTDLSSIRNPMDGNGLPVGMRNPADLSATAGVRSGQDMGLSLGGLLRNTQDMHANGLMRGPGPDFSIRNPNELSSAQFMNVTSNGNGAPNTTFQHQRVPTQGLPAHHLNLNAGTGGGPPNIGPPGSIDFAIHHQQLQAARAAAAQQQQQQMLHNLGLRGPLQPQQPQQQQQHHLRQPGSHTAGLIPPNHMMNHQPHLGFGQQLGNQSDFGHGASGGVPGGNAAHGHSQHGANPEAFLALFMGGQNGIHRNE